MKIAAIYVTNFLGVGAVEVQTPEPVQLFGGRNGAGKSSLRDAIALALTGELGRVTLKKDSGQLVHEGADLAVCSITDADGDEYKVSINSAGKIHDGGAKGKDTSVWPYVLDAQRFARMDLVERRAFLFGLMGLKTDSADIIERLKARQLDAAKAERLKPLLRSGFDAACTEAKQRATAAKGAWKAVTAETYGSEKAKAWRSHVPPFNPKLGPELATKLQHCDLALEQWQQTIGNLQAKEERRQTLRVKQPGLQEHAARIPKIQAKLDVDGTTMIEVTERYQFAQVAAGAGPRVGLLHDLAALVSLAWERDAYSSEDAERVNAALETYEREHGRVGDTAGDPDARARLPELKQAHDLMVRAIANDRRDLEAAQAAKIEADSIAAELAEEFDAAGLAEARAQVDQMKKQRADIVAQQDAQRSIKALVDGAEKKTADAALHAADVAAWDAIADALAPDGIPGEMLAEALGPFNERLAQSAADTFWPAASIGPDMAITSGGRDYRLVSESEKWRVDAMVAEAVAHLSGARLLVLDRFDVLDLPARDDLLAWLDVLADNGEIDSALVFGTLKAIPAELRPSTAGHWLENGVCAQLQEAA